MYLLLRIQAACKPLLHQKCSKSHHTQCPMRYCCRVPLDPRTGLYLLEAWYLRLYMGLYSEWCQKVFACKESLRSFVLKAFVSKTICTKSFTIYMCLGTLTNVCIKCILVSIASTISVIFIGLGSSLCSIRMNYYMHRQQHQSQLLWIRTATQSPW